MRTAFIPEKTVPKENGASFTEALTQSHCAPPEDAATEVHIGPSADAVAEIHSALSSAASLETHSGPAFWRKQLGLLLSEVQPAGKRRPVVRRSLLTAYLYATDLPQIAPVQAAVFAKRAAEEGWLCCQKGSWLNLRPLNLHFETVLLCQDMPAGPELQCICSLLGRHPALAAHPERDMIPLLKAMEEGQAAMEKACGILHGRWAEVLRSRRSRAEKPESQL